MWMTNRMDTDDINALCWSSGESKTQIVTRSKVNCNKLSNCRRVQYQEYPSFVPDFELTDSSSVSVQPVGVRVHKGLPLIEIFPDL